MRSVRYDDSNVATFPGRSLIAYATRTAAVVADGHGGGRRKGRITMDVLLTAGVKSPARVPIYTLEFRALYIYICAE